MRRWFADPVVTQVVNGDFLRSDLVAGMGTEDFLAELGRRTIQAYLDPIQSYAALWPQGKFDPKKYAKRSFYADGTGKLTFERFAGEVLAAWYDESFTNRLCGRGPLPHDNTPVFDSLAYEEVGDVVRVYLIQAKTTENSPASNANLAARKFAGIESGEFAYEFSKALNQMAMLFPSEVKRRSVMSAIYEREQRRFCVTAVHATAAPTAVLTRYNLHVEGETARRSAIFLRLPDWESAWEIVAAAAYAEISD